MDRHFLEQLDPRVLGSRLQQARRASGLTQQAVAGRVGMARTTVVSVEKGERRLSPGELIQFAQVYRRPVSDFVGRKSATEAFVTQFRTSERETLEANANYEQVALDLQRRSEDYRELENMLGSPLVRNYPPPYDPTGPNWEQIGADIAAAERNRLGLGDGPIGSLPERLEAEVGLRLFYFPMPSKIAGVFAFNEDLGGCIGINSNHPRDRRHWSLAHEYGHFLMHRYQPEITILEIRRKNSPKERIADAFTENFLMPATGLNRRFSKIHRASPKGATLADVVSLADLYRVSVQAFVLRLESLRRLPAGTWDRLVAEGFEVQTAQTLLGINADEQVANLFPRRYLSLAVAAFRNGEISEGQFARYLNTDRASARAIAQATVARIHREADGDFQGIEMDLQQSLESR